MASPAVIHPLAIELLDHVEGRLEPDAAQRVLDHVAKCRRCRAGWERLRAANGASLQCSCGDIESWDGPGHLAAFTALHEGAGHVVEVVMPAPWPELEERA